MLAPQPSADCASLTHLRFHLHLSLGSGATASDLTQLFADLEGLAQKDDPRIYEVITTLKANAANQSETGHPGLQPLVAAGDHSLTLPSNGSLKRTLSPYLLHDTIIIDVTSTLRKQDYAQPLSLLRPVNTLALQPSLGECYILYVQNKDLQSHNSYRSIAEAYAHAVCPLGLIFCSETILMNRTIVEFSDRRCTWFVWLDNLNYNFLQDEADSGWQQHFLNLLCCRAKINYAARASGQAFKAALKDYQAIEKSTAEIAAFEHISQQKLLPLSGSTASLSTHLPRQLHRYEERTDESSEQAKRIAQLESYLTTLPEQALSLARCQRDISTHRLTLTTNAFNAAEASRVLLNKNDTFLKGFLQQEVPTWLRQIDHDLQLLRSGQRYVQLLLSSLRAVVTLEDQKLQRVLDDREKERDRILQRTIFFVGAALSISGLAAATRPRPAARLISILSIGPTGGKASNTIGAAALWLGDILIHFVIGCVGATLVLVLVWWFRDYRRKSSSQPYE
jgi:hypothetical protein